MKLPCIAETVSVYRQFSGFDAVSILVRADLKDPLHWREVEREIEEALEAGAKLVFEFDFDFLYSRRIFEDQLTYASIKLAIKTFLATIYEKYSNETRGFILYRGRGDMAGHVEMSISLQESFKERLLEMGPKVKGSFALKLFSLEILMEYLHRLGALLPDEIPQFALFQWGSDVSRAEMAYLLSKEHFPYIYPAVRNARVPYDGPVWEEGAAQNGYVGFRAPIAKSASPSLGLILPRLGSVDFEEIEAALEGLEGKSYRLIPESLITEMWHELDELAVFSDAMEREGKRMLQGFIAAGGEVVDALEGIRGRGI